MQPFGAGEIKEGLVNRQGFHGGRNGQHELSHLAASLDIFRHIRLDDDGVGRELQGLEHRHGRLHAADARDVAGGRDNAPRGAADDHRFVCE